MSAMKTGAIGQTRFSKATTIKNKINTDRSGGGVQANRKHGEKAG